MVIVQGDTEHFTRLFTDEQLSAQTIYEELTDIQFEHFVKYVFEQAGYIVEHTGNQHGPGLDLKLFTGTGDSRVLHAGVQVKHYQPQANKVRVPEVVHLRGGLPETNDVTGYFVTTSAFNDQALSEAGQRRRIWPIDGERLVRYITYVRGSRPNSNPEAVQSGVFPKHSTSPLSPEVLFAAEGISRRPTTTTRVLTVANHKGGVGKTTTALNIAVGLASQGAQVLLVDMDAQSNLTSALGHPQSHNAAPMYLSDYYAGTRRLAELVRPTQFERVWLIPANIGLTQAVMAVGTGPETELQFVQDLHAPDITPPVVLDARPFDWIIIDTGPYMSLLTRSALAASHSVVMPVALGVFSEAGLELLLSTVSTMRALTNASIQVLGCLVTKWKDDALHRSLLAHVDATLADRKLARFEEKIPLDINNIEKAHIETGQGGRRTLFDRRCAAARAYTVVVEEIAKHG